MSITWTQGPPPDEMKDGRDVLLQFNSQRGQWPCNAEGIVIASYSDGWYCGVELILADPGWSHVECSSHTIGPGAEPDAWSEINPPEGVKP